MNTVVKIAFWSCFIWLTFLMVSSIWVVLANSYTEALSYYQHYVFRWWNMVAVLVMMIRAVSIKNQSEFQLF